MDGRGPTNFIVASSRPAGVLEKPSMPVRSPVPGRAALTSRALALACLLVVSGCASGRYARPLPAYAGAPATLFDDSVEPAAIGLDFDRSYEPMKDSQFRERLRQADGVLRVRISTVSSRTGTEDDPVFTFRVEPLETLHGRYAPEGPFEVPISPKSSTLGVFKHLEHKLVGSTFIAFTKDFRPPGGEPETHLHLAPDTPAAKKAVSDLVALDGLQ